METLSYGIVVCKDNQYLLSQRRDSVYMINIIRRAETITTREQAFFHLSNITKAEKGRLSLPFDTIWNDLFVNHKSRAYNQDREKCRQSYTVLTNQSWFSEVEEETRNMSSVIQWGFPKGRINQGESIVQCALREFREETNIPTHMIRIIPKEGEYPIPATVITNDNKILKSFYYFAKPLPEFEIKWKSLNGVRKSTISDEIGDLKFCTLEEAKDLLPPSIYNVCLLSA